MKSDTSQKISSSKKRVRGLPKHRTFKLTKKKLKQPTALPGFFKLFKEAGATFKKAPKTFTGLALLSGLLSLVFVQGLGSSFDILELKHSIEEIFGEDSDRIGTAAALFGFLIGSAGSGASEGSAAYQMFITIVCSLAVIWAARHVMAGDNPGIRESFYKGMYPLIPFLAVLFVISLQLIPLLLGNLFFTTVIQNELAVTFLEKFLWFMLFAVLTLLSLYLVMSSVVALYIATLPDMTPMKALRSARELVLHRRFAVSLRILALPAAILMLSLAVFMPILLFATPAAQILFTLTVGFFLVFSHLYMYQLYRSLL